MEITEVKVFPINEEKLKAFASVVFDGCFMVNDIKVIRGRDGLFISMPSRKKKNGEFKDVAHPLNNDTRRMIEGHVLGEYERILAERAGNRGAGQPVAPRPARRQQEPAAPAAGPAPRPAPPMAAARAGGDGAEPATSNPTAGAPATEGAEPAEKSLEEVQELHLRDSFWTVT